MRGRDMSKERKPTIEELEKLIGTADEPDIMPDGNIQAKQQPSQQECDAAMVEGFEHTISKEDEEWMNAPMGTPKQQPPAGDYPKRTIENTEVCSCGNIFVEDDDYDTLGSESGVCCPDCGNEKFQTVKDRLDSAESINADLLAACKLGLNAMNGILEMARHLEAHKSIIKTHISHIEIIEAAIEKATKG